MQINSAGPTIEIQNRSIKPARGVPVIRGCREWWDIESLRSPFSVFDNPMTVF
jgi:hypothetical protein